MTLDQELAQIALDAIAEFGKSVTYTPVSNGSYNPATSGAAQTGNNGTIKALVEGVTKARGTVQIGDKVLTVAAPSLAAEPTLSDKAAVGAVGYTVADWTTYYVGENPVLYEIHVRRA